MQGRTLLVGLFLSFTAAATAAEPRFGGLRHRCRRPA